MPHNFQSPALTMIAGINQSYFMGEFFLISGFFAEDGIRKRGAMGYLKDRIRRLGLPTLLFTFGVRPVVQAIVNAEGDVLQVASKRAEERAFEPLGEWFPKFVAAVGRQIRNVGKQRVNVGPLWFAVAGIVFTAGYVGIKTLLKRLRKEELPTESKLPLASPKPSKLILNAALIYLFAVPPASLLVRSSFPVGKPPLAKVPPYLLNVLERAGFQLGFFPGYIASFALGCTAGKYLDVLFPSSGPDPETTKVSGRLLGFSLLAIPTLPLLFVSRGWNLDSPGINVEQLAYAFWEPAVAIGISAFSLFGEFPSFVRNSIPAPFQEKLDKAIATMDRASLATYVFHPLPCVLTTIVLPHLFASLGLDWRSYPTELRAVLAGLIGVAGSWAVGIGVKTIPGADLVL